MRSVCTSTQWMPEMAIPARAAASRMVALAGRVYGLRIIPLSERFTRSTSAACRSTDMFLWSTPMPPARAMAMAISLSVTVSMAAETSGTLSVMPREKRVNLRSGELHDTFRNRDLSSEGFEGSDTAMCLERYAPELRVTLVRGSAQNIKVTYPQDLVMAEHILAAQDFELR